jgi:hypothetical protein
MGALEGCAPSVRSRPPPDLVPGCAGDASRSGHELKRACADSKGDLARGAAPQRTLNRQSSSQEVGTTARSFAADVGNGTIVTSGPLSCGEATPLLTSAFGGVGTVGGSVDAAGGSVVALGAGAMAGVFDSGGGEVSVEALGEVFVEALGEVSVEALGEVSVEALGEVSVEALGEVSVEALGEVSVEAGGESGGGVGFVVDWVFAEDWVSAETAGGSVVAADGSGEGVVGSGETAGGFVAAPLEAGAGSSARAVSTNAEAAREAATRASANPRGLSDRRRRLGSRLLRTTTHLPA